MLGIEQRLSAHSPELYFLSLEPVMILSLLTLYPFFPGFFSRSFKEEKLK